MGGTTRLGLVACAVVGLAAGSAGAGIVYTDIPDVVLPPPWAGDHLINVDMDGPADVRFAGFFTGIETICSLTAVDPATARVAATDTPPPPFGPGAYDWVLRRDAGYAIGAAEPWLDGGITFSIGNFTPTFGYWGLPLGSEGYAGVRFRREAGTWHHAWLRIGFTGLSSLTLFDMAWETEPEAPIVAGAVPGPGGAGVVLALAVCGGGRRRRRR
ncbi:MAG: hypothetical protein R3B68_16330 [Phycisphaerales bacterium]